MPETWEDEMCIDTGIPPIYLTRAERYMLFALAENSNIPERTMLNQLITQAYSNFCAVKRCRDE